MSVDQHWKATLFLAASRMGVIIEEDHMPAEYGDESWRQEGYWLLQEDTREGVWEDDNFSSSLEEVQMKLQSLAEERGLEWEKQA